MNKSVILIQVLIATSLSNPIDRITLPGDESVSKVGDDTQDDGPSAHVAIHDDEENSLVSKSVDSIISSSEVIKVNNIDNVVGDKHYSKALEERDKQGIKTKSIESTNEADIKNLVRNLEPESKASISTQSLHVEEKKAIGVESVTAAMEDDSTGDYLENPTDTSIETKNAPEEESKSTKTESVMPNDESNDSWDELDDLILTRRMMSDLDDKKRDRTSAAIVSSVDTTTVAPQESRQSISRQDENVKVKKGNDELQIIRLPSLSKDPTKGPLHQPEELPSYFVNPAKTNTIQKEESPIYRITKYQPAPARRNFGPIQKPLVYKGHTPDEYIPIQFPTIPSYTSPLLQNPIKKSAYILSKLFDASAQPIRNGRRMNNNPVGLATPKFLNINLPKLASSCGITRACALFTI